MKTTLRVLLIGAFIALFGWTFYFLYQKQQQQPDFYETTKPVFTDVVRKTVATGSVKPRNETEIKPQVSGIVEEIKVQPGEYINKGDLIARVAVVANMLSLNNAENRLEVAKLNLANAEKDHNRFTKLKEDGVISDFEFQQYEIALRNATQELNAAKDNLEIIKKGSARRYGSSANTLVRSTIDGMVLDIPVEEGFSVIEANNFNPGTTVALIADMGEMIFEGRVDESEVGRLKTGMDILIRIGAIENELFKGKLEYIAPLGVEEQGAIQFEIKASVEQKEGVFIRAGYSANADIVLEEKKAVLTVPEAWVIYEGTETYVYKEIQPQIFEKQNIRTGLSDGLKVEVLEGLSENDLIRAAKKEML